MKNYEEKKKDVMTQINNMDYNDIINLHNEYCDDNNSMDNYIYINDDGFFQDFYGDNVIEAVRAVSYGDYNYSHEYLRYNGYGNIVSFDGYMYAEAVDVDALADWVLDNDLFEDHGIERMQEE